MNPPATPSPPQDESSPGSRDEGPLPLWRIGTLGLAFLASATFLLISSDLLASPTAQALEVQLSFSQQSFDPGQTAVFHVADSGLDALFSCTATWVDADPGDDEWLASETYWNIFSGEPAPSAYQGVDSGCAFVSTSTTPLEATLDQQQQAFVNGVETSVEVFEVEGEFTGDATLNIDVIIPSTVAIPFYFHAQNSYAAAAQRVRVTSVADPVGEWAALSEVASTTDSTAAPSSGVFRGSVDLSSDVAAVEGDGVVSVHGGGDLVQLIYYGPSGQTAVSMASADVGALPPSPTPTPTPTATPLPDIAFSKPSFLPGQRAVFYVTDRGLNSLSSCTARWTDAVPDGVTWDFLTYWNIFTGEPAPSAYQGRGSDCAFVSASTTPLEDVPDLGGQPWVATVNGQEYHVTQYHEEDVMIDIPDLTSASTVALPFYFHGHDTYPASSQRARVSSGADPAGEWAALREVASTADGGAAIDSDVFRGSVELRADVAAVEGDGVVRVDAGGDKLRLRYYGPSGGKVVGASTALVLAPAPTDTPVRAAARRRRPTPEPTPTITPTRTPIPVVRRLATQTPTPAPTHTPTPTARLRQRPRLRPRPEPRRRRRLRPRTRLHPQRCPPQRLHPHQHPRPPQRHCRRPRPRRHRRRLSRRPSRSRPLRPSSSEVRPRRPRVQRRPSRRSSWRSRTQAERVGVRAAGHRH